MRRTLGQPEVLIASPRAIVPLAGVAPATSNTSMLHRAPGVELQIGAVLGTHAAVGREHGFRSRNRRHSLEDRACPLRQSLDERRQIRCGSNLLLPVLE